MLHIDMNSRKNRRGVGRRDFVRVGALSTLGLSMTDLFRAQADAADSDGVQPKAKSCIVLWMSGGPSHMDTFDLHPDAPSSHRGEFDPIDTKSPGLQICEHMPLLAKQGDKFSVLRGMTHPSPSHDIASHIMLTGNVPARGTVNPSYGSVVFRERGYEGAMPPYIAVPNGHRYSAAGFMGGTYKPFAIGSDPNSKGFQVRSLRLPGELTIDRLNNRRKWLAGLDTLKQKMNDNAELTVLDEFYQRSYDMISAPEASKAFDLSEEEDSLRDRYGRNTLGQSCLLARRLVEAGVSFVHVDRGGWDTHSKNFETLKNTRLPELDQAFSALLEDLSQQGLLDSTIVLWMGEFGRTPTIDYAPRWEGGRHHYSKAFSSVIAGGGFAGGHVVGATDEKGETVKDRPVLPWDVGASIFAKLGIPYDKTYVERDRNIRLLPFGTSVVSGGMLDELS
ncbi:MAG: DUF1501 domain-containing protein [Fuerstiella sp.]|nr:DUF1501 domain-containing protein [Fuerstiella sp.]MCP4784805.1 DUF1501 domain-containing protein [Fuerstiella sp.]MCP4853240.1 DUF1501 domain-containing protein [Fuerstiella sp.]